MTLQSVAEKLTLLKDGVPQLTLNAVSLERHHSGAFHLHAQLSFEDHSHLRSAELCHLSEQVIEPNMADFKPTIPVEIELRLLSRHQALLAPQMPLNFSAHRLLRAAEDSPLRQTDAWAVLNVKQQLFPGLKAGYQTQWAHRQIEDE